MRRFLLLFTAVLMTGLGTLAADDNESSFKMTPPPVSCLKFFPGVKQFTITGIHYTMGEMEGQTGIDDSPVAKGINADYAFSAKKNLFGAPNGAIISLSYLNVSMPMKLTGSDNNEMDINAYNLGIHWVVDIINGEKRDIAGEIIARKPTLALFVGNVLNFYSMNMGPLYEMLGFSEDIKSRTLTANYSIGAAADIPLALIFSVVPYIRYTTSQVSMTMKVPQVFYTTSELYERTYTSSYNYMDYGMDIDLRPFRNAPDWVISLGMAMAQMKGFQNGNRLLTLSIKHEIGKHYSSTMIGPALH